MGMDPSGTPRVRKPWYRARNIVLLLILVVSGWIGLEVYRAVTARPGAAIDYGAMVQELVRAAQPADVGPEDPNGWDLLQPAFAGSEEVHLLFQKREGPGYIDYAILFTPTGYDGPGYDPESQARLKADALEAIGLMREKGVFEAIAQASGTPFAMRPGPGRGPLVQMMLPDLGRSRNLARASAARMFLANKAGDGGELARAYEDGLAVGRIMTQQSFLIEHLVGYAITALANAELARDLIERRWDEGTLRACLAALDRQRAWMGSLEIALRAERLGVLDSIQWTHTDDGRGSGRLMLTALVPYTGAGGLPTGSGVSWIDKLFQYKIGNLAGLAYPSRRATTRKTNEYFEQVLVYYRGSASERAAMSFHPDTAVESMPYRYIMLRLLLPALGKSIQTSQHHELNIAGMRVMLAIEIYRARHGAFPASLADLAPEILPKVPQDPLGQAFGYRLFAPGEDADGRGYLLYSFGADLQDNGGKQDPNAAPIALQQRGAGLDLVINQPREKQPELPEPPPAPAPGAEPAAGEYSTPATGP